MKTADDGSMFVVMAVDFKDDASCSAFFDDMRGQFAGTEASFAGMEDMVKYGVLDQAGIYQFALSMEYAGTAMDEYIDIKGDGDIATMVMLISTDPSSSTISDLDAFYKAIGESSPRDLL